MTKRNEYIDVQKNKYTPLAPLKRGINPWKFNDLFPY
jgi:hypothetical protein